MFDLGTWGELLIIAIVALVVVGPKDLPKVLKALGRLVYKARKMTATVRSNFDDLIYEAEREDIKSRTKDKPDDKRQD